MSQSPAPRRSSTPEKVAIRSCAFAIYMDRQKDERECGVTIACTTKQFYTEKNLNLRLLGVDVRQKEERECGVTIACTTTQFYIEK